MKYKGEHLLIEDTMLRSRYREVLIKSGPDGLAQLILVRAQGTCTGARGARTQGAWRVDRGAIAPFYLQILTQTDLDLDYTCLVLGISFPMSESTHQQ